MCRYEPKLFSEDNFWPREHHIRQSQAASFCNSDLCTTLPKLIISCIFLFILYQLVTSVTISIRQMLRNTGSSPTVLYLSKIMMMKTERKKRHSFQLFKWLLLLWTSASFFFFKLYKITNFCQISKWIHHRYTCVPHPEPSSLLPPHTIPLGRPSALAPNIQYRALNLDWQLVSYMILYMLQCWR